MSRPTSIVLPAIPPDKHVGRCFLYRSDFESTAIFWYYLRNAFYRDVFDVAGYLNMPRKKIYTLAKDGVIPSWKIRNGGRILYPASIQFVATENGQAGVVVSWLRPEGYKPGDTSSFFTGWQKDRGW